MNDLICRQDAIDAMWKSLYAYEDLTEKQFMEHEELELEDWFQHRIFVQRMHEECMKAVESLPSANRTEPGRWEIKTDTDEYGLKRPKLVCSKCEKEPAAWDLTELFDFCPNCGVRMKNGKG